MSGQALKLVQTQDRNINQLQNNIKQALDPLIANPLNGGLLITKVMLVTGNNTITHGLGKGLTGWIPIRFHGSWAQIYDLQDTNPNKGTLILNAGASVEIDLYVF